VYREETDMPRNISVPLCLVKGNVALKTPDVNFLCNCMMVYIGQTGSSVET
jgi:hypothetical protein